MRSALAVRFQPIDPELRTGPHRGGAVPIVVTVAVALVVGWFGLFKAVPLSAVAYVVPGYIVVYLLARDPKWAVVGIIATTVFGLYRSGVTVGPVDVRAIDLAYVALVLWVLRLRVPGAARPGQNVGQLQLGILMAIFGASLVFYVFGNQPVLPPFISWLRLVMTFSLVWLVPHVVRTRADREFALRAFVILSSLELARSLELAYRAGATGRFSGANGPNTEALIAVAVIVIVINLPLFGLRTRVLLGALAMVVVLKAQSIGAFSALALVIGLYGFRVTARQSPRTLALLRPARVLLLVLGAIMTISMVRPRDLPTGGSFNTSSTAQRAALAVAGVEIFRTSPLFGVGWQRSSTPEVIGDPKLVAKIQARFTQVADYLLPSGGGVTVHNAYIQVLADTGLVGFSVMLVGLIRGNRGFREIRRRAGPEEALLLTVYAVVVVVLIWWNDNPLFGAQPESVIFAVFLGLLASARLARPAPSPEPVVVSSA